MLWIYITTALLPIFILVVKAKKIKDTQRQRAAWEGRLAQLNPTVLRNVPVSKEVVSGKVYYPSAIKQCDLFLLPDRMVMLAKKESWRYTDITATSLATQQDGLLPDVHETIVIQAVSVKESDGSRTLQIEGKDAQQILLTFTVSFLSISNEQLHRIEKALNFRESI